MSVSHKTSSINKIWQILFYRGELTTDQVPEYIRWDVVQILNQKMLEKSSKSSNNQNDVNMYMEDVGRQSDLILSNEMNDEGIDDFKFVNIVKKA